MSLPFAAEREVDHDGGKEYDVSFLPVVFVLERLFERGSGVRGEGSIREWKGGVGVVKLKHAPPLLEACFYFAERVHYGSFFYGCLQIVFVRVLFSNRSCYV